MSPFSYHYYAIAGSLEEFAFTLGALAYGF